MKINRVYTVALLLIANLSYSQPYIQWQKSFGGSDKDWAYEIKVTPDGGFIVGGSTHSNDVDVSGNHGNRDFWVVKFNAQDSIEWKKCLGGTDEDHLNYLELTNDNGYILAGRSKSSNGDLTNNYGGQDYWVVKLDSNGSIEWQKNYGGSLDEEASCIKQTNDNGYIITGASRSNDNDVSSNQGSYDIWIIKIDSVGNIIWEKSYGGSGWDESQYIELTSDNGFIVAGASNSSDGDVLNNYGNYDVWILKLDSVGSIEWKNNYGGTNIDKTYYITQVQDGSFIVAAHARSNDNDVSGNHGLYDYWIFKLDSIGSIIWQNSIGGSNDEESFRSLTLSDGSTIITGKSLSNDGDVSNNKGGPDYWIVKVSDTGCIIWEKNFGGTSFDQPMGIDEISSGIYLLAGLTNSTDGDITVNNGDYDFWVVKLGVLNNSTINPSVCDTYTSPSGKYIWTSSGIYSDTIPNSFGCDSIITINLSVLNSSSAIINAGVCDSYNSPSGKYTWTSSGVYYDTLSNTVGCDSIITVNLTINNTTNSTINPAYCDSFISPSGNYIWDTSGTYMDTIPNVAGCDSVITINLSINKTPTATIAGPDTICEGNSVTLSITGGVSYLWNTGDTSSSITVSPISDSSYSIMVNYSNNCIALDTHYIMVCPLPGSVTIIGQNQVNQFQVVTYSVPINPGSTYQWVVTGGNIISGGNTNSVTIQWGTAGVGNVSVIETNECGCSSAFSSSLEVEIFSGIDELNLRYDLKVYPNPFSFETTLVIDPRLIYSSALKLSLYNTLGQEVKSMKGISTNKIVIKRDNLPSGLYFFKLVGEGGLLGTGKTIVD